MESSNWRHGSICSPNRFYRWIFICLIFSNFHSFLEHFFTNLIPTVAGPVVVVANPVFILLWVTVVAITTVTDHSGYHLPFLKSPQFHDNHHATFNECFGTTGLMDFIFRTDVKFRDSINFKRHRVLLSLKSSINDLYPKVKKEVDQCHR